MSPLGMVETLRLPGEEWGSEVDEPELCRPAGLWLAGGMHVPRAHTPWALLSRRFAAQDGKHRRCETGEPRARALGTDVVREKALTGLHRPAHRMYPSGDTARTARLPGEGCSVREVLSASQARLCYLLGW